MSTPAQDVGYENHSSRHPSKPTPEEYAAAIARRIGAELREKQKGKSSPLTLILIRFHDEAIGIRVGDAQKTQHPAFSG